MLDWETKKREDRMEKERVYEICKNRDYRSEEMWRDCNIEESLKNDLDETRG